MGQPSEKAGLRRLVEKNLEQIVTRMNKYLEGQGLDDIEPILRRLGRGHQLPHWYNRLRDERVLPNLDGKTVGSVVEMLLVADVERNVLDPKHKRELRINPASGVDLPDMDLGVKSPSENWYTSEPFSNAYERILGTENDVVALITNYQEAKKNPPLRLQLTMSHYFKGSEIGDRGLCKLARRVRDAQKAFGETDAKRAVRLICYANQSDWLCKVLLQTLAYAGNDATMRKTITSAVKDFEKASTRRATLIPETYRDELVALLRESRLLPALLDLADTWLEEEYHGSATLPDRRQWTKFATSPLNGKLGVSLALQWRYNFGAFFKGKGNGN